ncbi:MAG: DUF2232 domain-containing protein [Thermodesulfobacteriota bacterium]|nr:DUF2232 domain-containing protein [Thermodesulfobacteriota bacterium]
MAGQDDSQKRPYPSILGIGLIATVFLLPILTSQFGWLHSLIPLPIFLVLVGFGTSHGTRIISVAVIISGMVSVLTGSLASLLVSFTLLPLGFYLAQAVQKKETCLHTAFMGVVVLIACWISTGFLYGLIYHSNPYNEIIAVFDQGISATYAIYQESSDLSEQGLKELEPVFLQLRNIVPVIMPAIVTISAVFTVWLNMTAGNWLLKKKDPCLTPWKDFYHWHLPEQLVWPVIIFGAGLILPASPFRNFSINGVLILGTLYFFQGLAVLATLFNKWSVPRAFRILVYALILIQAYGFVFLAIAGLADVWLDFRKSRSETK